jgi:hypothetical protein
MNPASVSHKNKGQPYQRVEVNNLKPQPAREISQESCNGSQVAQPIQIINTFVNFFGWRGRPKA